MPSSGQPDYDMQDRLLLLYFLELATTSNQIFNIYCISEDSHKENLNCDSRYM